MGVGTSDDFALKDIRAIFTMWMGSYFGDWNNESNFLRAPLGSGYALTSTYSGFPSTWYFPMALGETIGNCILLSQNNNTNGLYAPWDQGSHQVHISLHGDPTLKMFPVLPASNLNASTPSGAVNLSWSPSGDQNIVGYHIYRATSSDGPFTRVAASPVSGNSYSDSPPAGSYTYMVRAIKLEQSGSGSFYNPSQGIFTDVNLSGSTPQPPSAPNLQATVLSFSQVNLSWNDVANELGYKLERKNGAGGNWSEIGNPGSNEVAFSDAGLTASTDYYYRIRAFNAVGYSAYSSEVRATTPSAPAAQGSAAFVESDSTTQGTWANKFGADGYVIADGNLQLPSSIQVNTSLNSDYVWEPFTSDVRALLITPTNAQRIASAWYGDTVIVDVNVGTDFSRRMAIYVHDWDQSGRIEKIEISDGGSGVVLDSREASNFAAGVYYVYDIKGAVRVRATKVAGPNAIIAGVFFGGAVPGPISNKALRLALQKSSSSSLTCTISGDVGQKFAVQSSTDLKNWTTIQNTTLSTTTMQLPLNNSNSRGGLYFRTQNQP
jgi:hypothetical protein